MDLTPEEGQRIYQEEKARIEAQEQIKKEMAAKENAARIEQQRAQGAKAKRGCMIVLAVNGGVGPKRSEEPDGHTALPSGRQAIQRNIEPTRTDQPV